MRNPLTFKNIGGYNRTNGEQVHIEIHERRPRAGKVMAETMALALQLISSTRKAMDRSWPSVGG